MSLPIRCIKRVVIAACSIALAALFSPLILSTPAAAQAPPSAELAQKAPDAATLVTTAGQDGYVRIIVEFTTPISPRELSTNTALLGTLKAQIASTQDSIVGSHFGSVANPTAGQGFPRALQLMDITPMFAINVTQAELEALAADPRVVRIHRNKLNSHTLIDSVPLIGMNGAYAVGATGANQAVAIVDTGVQSNHEFLSGKVVAEACFSNQGASGAGSLCPNGQGSQTGAGAANSETANCINGTTELCAHGTHVAGIAAGNNTSQGGGEPPNGVAKGAMVVAVQVFTRSGTSLGAWDSDIILGLNWIAQNAVNLPNNVKLAAVNMSLGDGTNNSGYCDGDPTKSSIDYLLSLGVATVIAAGNESRTNGVSAPGCVSTAITVASSTKQDAISSFSNMGLAVDLVAPGSSIQSSVPTVPHSTTTYAFFNGTSMATPHVTGAIAAIRTVCPSTSIAQILSALQGNGVFLTDNRFGGSLTRTRISVDTALQQLACVGGGRTAVATSDFNGDGKSDILWRNSDGSVAEWLMNVGAYAGAFAALGVDNNWQMVATGDFNGDGKADILWRHADGSVAMWLMNGAAYAGAFVALGVDNDWHIDAVGDFNGDGKSDILWRHNDGSVAVWFMNGAAYAGALVASGVDNNWHITAVGDFNGDGKTDILWRHTDGSVAEWLMNGPYFTGASVASGVPTAWQVVGVGDFNGDGKADILWRYVDGSVAEWLMNGPYFAGVSVAFGVDTNWQIVGVGDFNGDGKADILWRYTDGSVAEWLMNSGAYAGVSVANMVPTSWTTYQFPVVSASGP